MSAHIDLHGDILHTQFISGIVTRTRLPPTKVVRIIDAAVEEKETKLRFKCNSYYIYI